MNRLSQERRSAIIATLVEGCSIRSTVRITGASKNTVAKLLVDIGAACSAYQDRALSGLTCSRLQCDELWAFCQMKEKNVPEEKRGVLGYGDVWTWTALCADTKLVPSWRIGDRSAETARLFIEDLAGRLACRVQLTTDGYKVYVDAVDEAFRGNIDYAMLIKLYGKDQSEPDTRYSPARCIGTKALPIMGNPDEAHVSTSFVERQNLTMRMSMRRFTRLTNAFSRKVENLAAAVSLHFMNYNFARIHQTLRVTPAMEAGVSDHVWSIAEIVALLERSEKSKAA